MKNLTLLFLLTFFYLNLIAQNNPGDVVSYKKISNGLNGLGNILSYSDLFGADICNVGDINNDGISDLAVGSIGHGTSGGVRILFMDTNGTVKSTKLLANNTNGVSGITSGGQFGASVCALGDINSDGIPDIAVGEPNSSIGGSGKGAIHILTLDSLGVATSQSKIDALSGYGTGGLPLQTTGYFGSSMDTIGDLNNDGIVDLIVGSHYDGTAGQNRGAVYVLFINNQKKVSSYHKIYQGVTNFNPVIDNFDYFGSSVCGLNDYDNDGIEDIAVGAFYDDDGSGDAGAFYIIHLLANGNVKSYKKISNLSFTSGNPLGGNSGVSISLLEDLDGDGINEIGLGAYRLNSDNGATFIIFLDSNENVKNYNLINQNDISNLNYSRFGNSICNMGDFNNDGKYVIAVGAVRANIDMGSIYIISLRDSSLNATIVKTNITCNGVLGTAKVVSTNQFTPLTYQWSTGAFTDSISNLSAGNYSVTITNTQNKKAIRNFTISNYPAINFVTTGSSSVCAGQSKNLISFASGGSGSFTYHWSHTSSITAQQIVYPVTATTYTVFAKDANNCSSDTVDIIIGVNPLPNVSFSGLNVAYCNNANTTTLVGSPVGGSFNGSGVTATVFNPTLANIGSNQIIYSYTDGNGCIGKDTLITSVYAAPNVQFSGISNAYCNNHAPLNLNNKATPAGGSFWVNGLSTSIFSPSGLGAGTHVIKYQITNASGCSDIDSITTFINPTTSASLSGLAAAYCQNSTAVTLSGTPVGGNYFGIGMTGAIFNPTNAGLGSVSAFYKYTNMFGCTDTAVQNTIINSITPINVSTTKSIFCNSDASVPITTTFTSGTLSGNGVNISDRTFSPTIAGVGTHSIFYQFINPYGCTSNASQSVTVNAPATISINNLNTNYCLNTNAVILTGIPSSGIFFGTGISGNSFSPSNAGVGLHAIAYRYDNGCVDTFFQNVTVNNPPTAYITELQSSYCSNGDLDNLVGMPTGGSFIGSGISSTTFNPSAAGSGTHLISYISPSDVNNCVDTAFQLITVNNPPTISFGSMAANQCENSTSVSLLASPTGGTFGGLTVSGDTFKPVQAGIGNHRIYYSVTDVNSCTSVDSFTFVVHQLPTISFSSGNTCSNISTYSLSATPTGGIFTGNFISGNVFNPLLAGIGSHQVTYSYTDGYGCTNTNNQNIIVNSLPNISFTMTSLDFCKYSTPITLSALPSGGNFSGVGITGNVFSPSMASIGSNSISYSFTDANGCTNSSSKTVNVHARPIISFGTLASNQCVNSSPVNIGATPIGGTYSGNSVSSGLFYPSIAGTGNHKIYYSYSDSNSCNNIDSFIFNVHPTPSLNFPVGSSCSNISALSLNATPIGGSFSGNYVTNNIFSPINAGTGSHAVTYTFTDLNSCTNSINQNIVVNAPPVVNFSLSQIDYCINANPINLTAMPLGGTFTGSGINSNIFNPTNAGIGNHPLIYTFTDANLCSNSDTNVIVVHNLPSVTINGNQSTYCRNDAVDTFVVVPNGGSMNGQGMTGNIFNPSLAYLGNNTISYTYTDAFGCSNTHIINILVNQNPTVTVTGLANQICKNDSALLLQTSPFGGFFLQNYIVNSNFTPSLTTSGWAIVSYQYSDSNNCYSVWTDSILVHLNPMVEAGIDTLIPCNSLGAILGESTQANHTYVWTPYAGLSSPFVSSPLANPWQNTTYLLTKTDLSTNCKSYDSVNISIPIQPSLSISGDTVICFGDTLHLIAQGTPNIQWDYAISGSNFDYKPYINQYINAVGIDSNFCVAMDSVLVLVNALPNPQLGPDLNIFDQDSAELSPGNFQSYFWNTGETSSKIWVRAQDFTPGNYTYFVRVENQEGCFKTDTIVISITTGINNLTENLNIKIFPNPTYDWLNIQSEQIVRFDDVQIFNMQGKLVKTLEINSISTDLKIKMYDLLAGQYLLTLKINGIISTFKILVQ